MSEKATVGVLIITLNEEKNLKNCLDSIQGWVNEIVILDSGSTDKTKFIAEQYPIKWFEDSNWPGFGIQRQKAQEKLSTDWVLALDADEIVTSKLKESILNAVKNNDQSNCYMINRLNNLFGKFIKHSGWSPDWIVRLYPRNKTNYNSDLVHEKVILKKLKTSKLEGKLLHYTGETISSYLKKSSVYIDLWVNQNLHKKSSLTKAIIHAKSRFFKTYILKLGFLDGKHGFLIAIMASYHVFLRYTALALRNKEK